MKDDTIPLSNGVTLKDLNEVREPPDAKTHFSIFFPKACTSGNNYKEKHNFMDFISENYKPLRKMFKKRKLKAKIIFYYHDACSYDIDNLLKTLFDSLQGIVYTNDCLIKELYVRVDEYAIIEGVSVEIYPIGKK